MEACQPPRDPQRVGFDLGWNYAAYERLRPPESANSAVQQGFQAGLAHITKRRPHDRYVRKWLQLCHNAYLRGRYVSPDVTPAYLRQIDIPVCPVTFLTLAHGDGEGRNWSIDRLNNDGAYADGNLVVMSTKANLAKGAKNLPEVIELASGRRCVDGLAPREWGRLASLMIGPCTIINPTDLILPQTTFLPPMIVTTPAQAAQYSILTGLAIKSEQARLLRIKRCLSSIGAERAFHRLVSKMKRKMERFSTPPSRWQIVSPFDIWTDAGIQKLYREWIVIAGEDLKDPKAPESRRLMISGSTLAAVVEEDIQGEWGLGHNNTQQKKKPGIS